MFSPTSPSESSSLKEKRKPAHISWLIFLVYYDCFEGIHIVILFFLSSSFRRTDWMAAEPKMNRCFSLFLSLTERSTWWLLKMMQSISTLLKEKQLTHFEKGDIQTHLLSPIIIIFPVSSCLNDTVSHSDSYPWINPCDRKKEREGERALLTVEKVVRPCNESNYVPIKWSGWSFCSHTEEERSQKTDTLEQKREKEKRRERGRENKMSLS